MLLQKYFALHEWELSKLPFFSTVVGRHVYVCIAREVLAGNVEAETSLKKLLSTNHFTDRAIRLKIREMESMGYLMTEEGIDDRRLRSIRPTISLLNLIQEHSKYVDDAVLNQHYLVKKQAD